MFAPHFQVKKFTKFLRYAYSFLRVLLARRKKKSSGGGGGGGGGARRREFYFDLKETFNHNMRPIHTLAYAFFVCSLL